MRNLEETFGYNSQNRLTGVWLNLTQTGSSAYDSYGRMTTKTANGQAVFSNVSFSSEKPHALTSATTAEGVFPSAAQTVTYTGFDKVSKVKQGNDSLCYSYGYDRQRILMEEHVGTNARTKQYWGACELLTESVGNTTISCWRTFVSGPYGVFAVVETRSGMDEIHYVLKDNLGSWTTITDGDGFVQQRLGYDAWGNLRDPDTWANGLPGDNSKQPMFDWGFTGHEHIYNFGLINMNGRMYDPVMSSFLSADRFVQNPMSAQGFNRYAYCMNNPLRYVDPTGWLSGGGGGSGYKPVVPYYSNGMITVNLPEITIIADNPSLSNTNQYEEYEGFEYTPNITSGGFDNGWGGTRGWSSSGHSGGSGGGNGNHGGSSNVQQS